MKGKMIHFNTLILKNLTLNSKINHLLGLQEHSMNRLNNQWIRLILDMAKDSKQKSIASITLIFTIWSFTSLTLKIANYS